MGYRYFHFFYIKLIFKRYTYLMCTLFANLNMLFTRVSPYGLPWGPHIYFIFVWSNVGPSQLYLKLKEANSSISKYFSFTTQCLQKNYVKIRQTIPLSIFSVRKFGSRARVMSPTLALNQHIQYNYLYNTNHYHSQIVK